MMHGDLLGFRLYNLTAPKIEIESSPLLLGTTVRSTDGVHLHQRIPQVQTTPAKNPRTECGCQPVEAMMPAMVAPPGRRSRTRTRACFESARVR